MTESESIAIKAFIVWLNRPTARHIPSLRDPDEVLAQYLADTEQAVRPDVNVADMTFSATQMEAITGAIWAEFERQEAEHNWPTPSVA